MLNVLDRGASQTAGPVENTEAIQQVLNNLPFGETLLVPTGCTLRTYGATGLRPKSGAVIQLDGTLQLVTKPNEDRHRIFYLGDEVRDVVIQGQGTLRGDRDVHVGNESDSGATGYCVEITAGASNILLKNIACTNAWADGICVGGTPHDPRRSKNLTLDGVRIMDNRRNGFSAMDLDGLRITGCQFLRNGAGPLRSTPPRYGIDLECDTDAQAIMNVVIERTVFSGNGDDNIGIGSPHGTYRNIYISPTNVYDWKHQPIAVTGNAGKLGTTPYAALGKILFESQPWYRYWGFKNEWRSA